MMGSANALTGSNPHECGCAHAHSFSSFCLSLSFLFLSVYLSYCDRNDNGAVCSPYHYHVLHCTYLVGYIIKDYLNLIVIQFKPNTKNNKL